MHNGDAIAELRKISKILILSNAERLEKELSKFMSTDDRKRIWVAIDGESDPKQIALKAGIPHKTVQNFLPVLKRAELVETTRGGAPRKRIDYVPSDWLLLMKTEGGEQTATETGPGSVSEGTPPLDKDWGNPPAGSPSQ